MVIAYHLGYCGSLAYPSVKCRSCSRWLEWLPQTLSYEYCVLHMFPV